MLREPLRIASALAVASLAAAAVHAEGPSPAEARAIAKDAYAYGLPLVENYRQLHDRKGAWNQIRHDGDTHSYIGADLRTEPLVITLPRAEKPRSYKVRFVDLCGNTPSKIASGSGGGRYVLAGPSWTDAKPDDVREVLRSRSDFVLVVFDSQEDADRKMRSAYRVQTYSGDRGGSPRKIAPPIELVKPLGTEQRTSLAFFDEMNYVLGLCPARPADKARLEGFAKLGIGPKRKFDAQALPAEVRRAVEEGVAEAARAVPAK